MRKCMRMKTLLVLIGLFASLFLIGAESQPGLLFTDAAVAHLKTPEGQAEVIRLAEREKKHKMEALSLAWRVTGDRRYAEQIRSILLKECSGKQKKSDWGGGLGGAHKCLDMAIGYDSIRTYLSAADRSAISSAIVERGIRPLLNEWLLGSTRMTTLDSMGHNWWSSCVFLPAVAALAVAEDQPCVLPWLERIKTASAEWFSYPGSLLNTKPATFDSNGGFYESVGYANYALSTFLTFRTAWKNVRKDPLPEIPLLEKTGDFFLHACYPNSGGLMSLNFGDSSLHAVGSAPLVWLWANGIRPGRYLWYLRQTADSDYKEAIRRDSPLGLVFFPSAELNKAPAVPDLPHSVLYPDMGWAIMRNSWKKDATMIGIKSGFTWNHAHADAGSFILFHRGENLLIDSGNCWYPHPEYDAYYRQSRAHNVVLFNGEGENPEDTYHGSKFPGTVRHLVDAGSLKYVLADATGPTSQNFIRNYRSFLWIDDVILIIDDLKTFKSGKFEWLLHFDGRAGRRGDDLEIVKGKARIAVRPLFPERLAGSFAHDTPERLRLVEKSGLKDHAQNVPVPYYAIVPPGESRVMKFITAILLNPENPPRIERLEAVNAHGVRISRGSRSTEIWLNLLADGRMRHRNSNNTLGGWETDAYLLAVTSENGKPIRFFVGNGSYLRKKGNVLLDSLKKVFAVRENGKVVIY